MTKKQLPTPAELRKLLRYEPETGKLFWRERTPDMFNTGSKTRDHNCNAWNAKYAGKSALNAEYNGYRRGGLLGYSVKSHRVIWALHRGEWPTDQIDHINHDRADNRIENLRVATHRMNSLNQTIRCTNTSGKMGVSWDKVNGRWMAQILVNGVSVWLGRHRCKTAAIFARDAAERKYGFHPNHGV